MAVRPITIQEAGLTCRTCNVWRTTLRELTLVPDMTGAWWTCPSTLTQIRLRDLDATYCQYWEEDDGGNTCQGN